MGLVIQRVLESLKVLDPPQVLCFLADLECLAILTAHWVLVVLEGLVGCLEGLEVLCLQKDL